MTRAKFEKLSLSDKSLYGSRKLLLCGFTATAQPKFMVVLKIAGLDTTPTVWTTSEQGETCVGDLLKLPERYLSQLLPLWHFLLLQTQEL